MKVRNPFTPNDWDKLFILRITIAFQLIHIGIVGAYLLGFPYYVPFQIFEFVFLSYVPGIMLVRVLKLHNLGGAKTTLLAVGLSITMIMALGLVLSVVGPIVGIAEPISFVSLSVSLLIIVMTLCLAKPYF